MPLFVLGGGSNVLVADAGFDGLALHVASQGIELDGDSVARGCGSGVGALRATGHGGRIGRGRVSGGDSRDRGRNAGAECGRVRAGSGFGHRARARIRPRGRRSSSNLRMPNADLRIGGADSIRWIEGGISVTRVDYRLRRGGAPTVAYGDLKKHFSGWEKTPTLAEVADAVRGIRQSKGMLLVEGDPDCRSAGSFFKNPLVAPKVAEHVRQIVAEFGRSGAHVSCRRWTGEDSRGVAD